jgi:hypothetical protein
MSLKNDTMLIIGAISLVTIGVVAGSIVTSATITQNNEVKPCIAKGGTYIDNKCYKLEEIK